MGKKKRKLKERVDELPEQVTPQQVDDWFTAKIDEIDREHQDRRATLTRETTTKVAEIARDHHDALEEVGKQHDAMRHSEQAKHSQALADIKRLREDENKRHAAQITKIKRQETEARQEVGRLKGLALEPFDKTLRQDLEAVDTWKADQITLAEHEREERLAVLALGEAPDSE